jgi:hypothetical protein
MSDSSEQTIEIKKSTARAAAMAKTWAARREWAANPVCCCGCGAKLAVGKDPEHQRLFCQGHDGRLHKMLRKVLRGEVSRTFRRRRGRTSHGSSSCKKTEKF